MKPNEAVLKSAEADRCVMMASRPYGGLPFWQGCEGVWRAGRHQVSVAIESVPMRLVAAIQLALILGGHVGVGIVVVVPVFVIPVDIVEAAHG